MTVSRVMLVTLLLLGGEALALGPNCTTNTGVSVADGTVYCEIGTPSQMTCSGGLPQNSGPATDANCCGSAAMRIGDWSGRCNGGISTGPGDGNPGTKPRSGGETRSSAEGGLVDRLLSFLAQLLG